jgi:hypothetical protein
MAEFAKNLIAAYGQGNQAGQEETRRGTIAAYLPGAMKGNEADIGAVAQVDPGLGFKLQETLRTAKADDLARAKETWQLVDSIIRKKDGSFITDPKEFEFAQMLLRNRGAKPEEIAQLRPENMEMLARTAEMMRGYNPEERLRDERAFAHQDRMFNETARANRVQEAARAQGGAGAGGFSNMAFDNISSLRKEYQSATKDFGTVRDAYGRIKATSSSASPAGDIAMIYAFMKMLDPGSVVRETEFATAQNAKPLLDRLGVSWDSVKSAWEGTRLQPTVRQDFLKQANSLYSQQLGQYKNVKNTYGTLSQRFGIDPSLVLTDQTGGIPEPEEPPPSFTPGGVGKPISTQAEFDALPSGTVYTEPDGQQYRKP